MAEKFLSFKFISRVYCTLCYQSVKEKDLRSSTSQHQEKVNSGSSLVGTPWSCSDDQVQLYGSHHKRVSADRLAMVMNLRSFSGLSNKKTRSVPKILLFLGGGWNS